MEKIVSKKLECCGCTACYHSCPKQAITMVKDLYGFNLWGLIGIVFGFRVKLNNKFYCAEFVKYILDNSGVELELPDMIKPEDFRNIKIGEIVYKGKLREYNI